MGDLLIKKIALSLFAKILLVSLVTLIGCIPSVGEDNNAIEKSIDKKEFVGKANNSQAQISIHEFVDNISADFSTNDDRVRAAAVKVYSEFGHGSGTYVKFKGFDIIITASHVVDDLKYKYRVEGVEEFILAKVIYHDKVIDVAALLLDSPMKTRVAMKYRPLKKIAKVSTKILYSGYPAGHNLLTIKGMVAGYAEYDDQKFILIHSFGWFGCSGSGIYDMRGNFVGVLWGIDVELSMYGVHLIEDILYITPASSIDNERILNGICRTETEDSECKKYFRKRMNKKK